MNDTTAKGLGLGCVLALLFLALALVVIFGWFSVGMIPGRATPTNPPTSRSEATVKTEPTPKPAEVETRPDTRVKWSDIPEPWAVWPAAGIPAGKYRGALSAPTLRALLETIQLDPGALAPENVDKLYRRWGLLNSVDYLLARACKLEPNDDATWNDRNQVPLLLFDGVRIPEDTGPAKDALLGLLSEGMDKLVQATPQQYQAEGLDHAFTTRALLLLATLGNDARTMAILQDHLKSEDPRIRSSAAYGLVLQGNSSVAVDILAKGESDASFNSLVGALSGFNRKEVIRADGTKDNVPDVLIDRSLDASLLAAAQRHPGNADLLSSLAVRLDNPTIRAYVTSTLLNSNDPAAARSLVRVYPDLVTDPAYLAASKRWATSEDPALRHWGLQAMSELSDPSIPSMLHPVIQTGDSAAVYRALKAQKSSVVLDPPTVLAGIKSIIDRQMLKDGIALYAKQALIELEKSPSVDEAIKTDARLILRKMGGWGAK